MYFFRFFLIILLIPVFSFAVKEEKLITNKPLRVLIVPGHDNDSIGASFKGVGEVALNRQVAKEVFNFLKEDKTFEPILAHDGNDYMDELKEYFRKNEKEIDAWRQEHADRFKKQVRDGAITDVENPSHGDSTSSVIQRLYGINKWAGENKIDLIIHIHFNDYGGRKRSKEGVFTGFAVYVPESQYPNAKLSMKIGRKIWSELGSINYESNQSQEASFKGPIEDQDLIALGSYGTLNVPSILIEYGYIYEPIIHSGFFDIVSKRFAFSTYKGIKKWFLSEFKKDFEKSFEYSFDHNLKKGSKGGGVFVLQTKLKELGFFPPEESSRNLCPIDGIFNSCTEKSLRNFQSDNNLTPNGILNEVTREKLKIN